MTIRLHRDEITDRIQALQASLTAMQTARLTTIRDLVADDGRFQLRAALDAGEFPQGDARAQDAFQDFRHKVNTAADQARVDLQLVLDSRKTTPDARYGWFTGDPVDSGLISYARETSGQTGIARPVTPEVTELGQSRRFRVYVGFHPTTGDTARRANALLGRLRDVLQACAGQSWEVLDSRAVGLGEDAMKVRDRLCTQADVRVALISPAFLAAPEERHRVLNHPGRIVAFPFSGLPDAPVDVSPLRRHDLAPVKPWDELTRTAQRTDYINALVSAIQKAMTSKEDFDSVRPEDDKSIFVDWTSRQLCARNREDSEYLVPLELAEAPLQDSLLHQPGYVSSGPPLNAVDRLVEWAMDDTPAAPRLCALLGDVGMGKTTTSKLFAQQLLDLHQQNSAVPTPLLFDLREVRVNGLTESMTLDHILNTMLEATRPAGMSGERLNADVVRRRLAHGHTVIVFDGLDEVLVHLSPHDRQLFTRQLWRALPNQSTTRMLLTCRTQYFRNIRDEAAYFTGGTRQALRGEDYLGLLMLPFRDEQIREYLAGNLDRDVEWVDRFLETIAAVHDLPDLARRPITLRLIADQVEFIETAKLEGRTLRSVDIYSEVVDRWISRDEGKHTLTPDHKRLLMEEIAAGLWRSGRNAWSPSEVDEWLLGLFERRPELRRHYRGHLPDLWTADFRTATFLKREGDTFQFGHRSLSEYFLARYLLRTLTDTGLSSAGFDALAMPVASPETLDFLGQSLAGATVEDRGTAVETLRLIGHQYRRQASELALAYALHAHRRGYPHQSLCEIDLAGADLSGWSIGIEDQDNTLRMVGADFTRADLRRTVFHNADLTGADLTTADASGAEFHHCALTRSLWQGARAVGTVLRRCKIDSVDLEHAQTYRTQLLSCTPPPDPIAGLLIAPATPKPDAPSGHGFRLGHFTGHDGLVTAVAWSPDSTHVLTGGSDRGVRVWDVATGEVVRQFIGPAGPIRSVAWSPDGNHILASASSSGISGTNVWVWDVVTGKVTQQLPTATRRSSSVMPAAWSPDGAHILTGGASGFALVWDAVTGEVTQQLTTATTQRSSSVRSVAWSPDGAHILTGGGSGFALVWDAVTGEVTRQLTGPEEPIESVAWSPDGSRILASGGSHESDSGSGWVWDAVTGEMAHRLIGPAGPVRSAVWSPDSIRILATDGRGSVWVWDAVTGVAREFAPHVGPVVGGVAWSPDGTHILASGGRNSVSVWDAVTGEMTQRLAGRSGAIRAVAWSPDDTHVLVAGIGPNVWVWDAVTGDVTQRLTTTAGRLGSVGAVAWSPDSTHILTGGRNSVCVWDAITGELVRKFAGPAGPIGAAAWSPDGTHILASSGNRGSDGSAWVWNAVTGEMTQSFTTGRLGSVGAAAWSPDSTHILTGGGSGVCVWSAITGELVRKFAGPAGSVGAVAWSPDGTHILASGGSVSGTIHVWDAVTGEMTQSFATGRGSMLGSVAWSPDSTHILTGGRNSVCVWDAITGELVRELAGPAGQVRSVAWSPDGTHILTGGSDSVQSWDAVTGEPSDLIFAHFTSSEIATYRTTTNTVIGCTDGAWRWLGWSRGHDGIDRLPGETLGELPSLLHPKGQQQESL